MRAVFNYQAGVIPEATAMSRRSKSTSFGSISVQPQNKEQVQKMSQIAYKTKETVESRFGSPTSLMMKAGITQDTVTFSTAGTNPAKQNLIDSVLQFYLRKTDIPFKQI